MKFHITITDNETGETLCDQDTCCIIGACDSAGEGTHLMTFTSCNGREILATTSGALEQVEGVLQRIPKSIQRLIRKTARKEARNDA